MQHSDATDRRLRRAALLVFAAGVPSVLLVIAVGNTILNHFFAHSPYLLDAGWYSDIVYHAGIFPKNPTIACDYAEWYYGVHPSLYVSLFSLLSYVSPLPRIEWYTLFQVMVFLPFAWAVYALAAKVQPIRSWAGIAIAALAAMAFTFSGQILRMIPYPHYEVAIPAYICLMLVMLTTGRQRWAWVFYCLALSIREDAGVHTAMALLPLVYLKWRGTELAPRMRTLLVMCAVGIGTTVIGSLSQKVVFHGPSIMGIVYLGDPIYSHINGGEIARRAAGFLHESKFLFYPFVATCVLAAVRRDARFLLGWLAGAPWFLLNFFAAQPQKSTFDAYSGFPYIVSVFWVLLYGSLIASRRMRTPILEAVFAVICVTSTIGLYQSSPASTDNLWHEFHTRQRNRDAVHAFVEALGKHRGELGHLRLDYGVASLALEYVRDASEGYAPGARGADTIAFHDESVYRDSLVPDMIANRLDTCTRIVRTGIYLCGREPPPAGMFAEIRTWTMPSIFAFATNKRPGVKFDNRGMTLDNGAIVDGHLGLLPKGNYELTSTIESDPHPSAATNDLAVVQILSGATILAETTVPIGSTELAVRFDAPGDQALTFRYGSRIRSVLVVKEAHVRAR